VNHDGRLVDPRLLARMTEALGGAGPDAQHVWLDGAVGLGHAWLRPSPDAPAECQPLSLDGAVWIAADARVDDRRGEVRGRGSGSGSGSGTCRGGMTSERTIEAPSAAPMMPSDIPIGNFPPYQVSSHTIFSPTNTRTTASP